ncbi:energy-coupling factor ABC transporter permease [Thermosediminibacter oceani]|uniref:Cobalt transport protein CbiM n=1 Tax=Thermosediminibacter oceani (strain ATCC BAA-1034 / DSM 16646 / JW/IW-1228P) TaxID=555079 RepID=CBIM_THEOJ|nr:RecName: Full=Cobalt transport protein CbiM; AltName: Full=Energy-coupling factor transporter probable substrate-capture protein CbiM; Short=ECF transporter S component CbiM; Flags: Precursor [Thermosediminibacter oceani DSM 16646]ADL07085.1 cobalamin biosynthesis protein CbiM [Thermosediminibacter oceani DSM 16646]
MRKITFIAALLSLLPRYALAMHVMEGFLPFKWCLLWYSIYIPFLMAGLIYIKKNIAEEPSKKILLGFAGAFVFALSALKLPSVAGSSSHPTGIGLGAILLGPLPMAVIGGIVLLFQALLLAHGGITTLGANAFSMAVAGSFAAYGLYKVAGRVGLSKSASVFLGAASGDLMTYIITSLQLALAFPASRGGVAASFAGFSGIFAVTQLPLAIGEGILTVIVLNLLEIHAGVVVGRLVKGASNDEG